MRLQQFPLPKLQTDLHRVPSKDGLVRLVPTPNEAERPQEYSVR
jgi:hypothetical protein